MGRAGVKRKEMGVRRCRLATYVSRHARAARVPAGGADLLGRGSQSDGQEGRVDHDEGVYQWDHLYFSFLVYGHRHTVPHLEQFGGS